MYSLEEEKIHV